MSLTEQEVVRYSRHIILPEVGGRGQRKLKAASVLIAGVGAAGSAAALYLAAAGIGQIALWDPAELTVGDLASSIAHDAGRVGQSRARSAAVALAGINPDARIVVIETEHEMLEAVGGHAITLASIGPWDAVVAAAFRHGHEAILFGSHGMQGACAAFGPGQPCLQCLGEERAMAAGLYPEEEGRPALAAAAGVIGVAAATEAVKRILGVGDPLFGRVICYDGWQARFREEGFGSQAGCELCGG